MSTITKEWLQQTIAEYEANRDELPFGLDTNSFIELQAFKLALASLEAEPVGYFGRFDADDEDLIDQCSHNISGAFPLYSAPPAPVSEQNSRAITQHFDTLALEAAREIMCDVNRRHEFLGGEVQLLSRIQCRIDDSCRAAMLQGAEPVTTACKLPELTDSQCLEFLAVAFRHASIKGDIEFDDIRLGLKMALEAAPQQEA